MNLHFINSEYWHKINTAVSSILQESIKLDSKVGVRIYKDTMTALYECAHGTAQFYAHKRSLILQLGASPYFSQMQKLFLREGYNVLVLETEKWISDDFQMDAFEAQMKKDTNFCLLHADHPVTGEKYPLQNFEHKVNEKKIYTFILHHNFYDIPEHINPYSIHIFNLNEMTLVLSGERFKTPFLFSEFLEWKNQDDAIVQSVRTALTDYQQMHAQASALKDQIVKIEKEFPSVLQNMKDRYFDRALVQLENINADILLQELQKQFPELSSKIQTTNLCWHQNNLVDLNWWKRIAEDQSYQQELNNCLIIPAKVLIHQPLLQWLSLQKKNDSVLEFEIKL